MLTWAFKTLQHLSAEQTHQILQLRAQVFVVEQNCPYLDVDNQDLGDTVHVMGLSEEYLAAYARLIHKDNQHWIIGRVCVAQHYRQFGYGRELMNRILHHLQQHNVHTITLAAQTYLTHFYQSFGFSAQGQAYLEDGIPHIDMIKRGV